jgi:integrase
MPSSSMPPPLPAHGASATRLPTWNPRKYETGTEPKAYSPEDAAKLMQTALDQKPELVPVLALGLFCGLRVSEAIEADLAKLPRTAGEFRTTGKTGPRMAPFTKPPAAWMAKQTEAEG